MISKSKKVASLLLGEPEPEYDMLHSERSDLMCGLNYYSRHMNYDDSKKLAIQWASDNLPMVVHSLHNKDVQQFKNIGFVCRILDRGFVDDEIQNRVRVELTRISNFEKYRKPKDIDPVQAPKKVVQEVNQLLESYDYALDEILYGRTPQEFSLGDNRKHVAELTEHIHRLQKQIEESPEYFNKPKPIQKYLKELLNRIDNFSAALKKSRVNKVKPKKVDPVKMVDKLVIADRDEETGFISQKKRGIIGATKLIVWNPTTRTLTSFVSTNENGFLVSGRSLKNFDMDKSISKKIRKPVEMSATIKNMTATKIHIWLRDECKTTTQVPKALIADGSILVKV